MRFESQSHPQDDHVDRITDCSTRYGQAPAVCTRMSLDKGRWVCLIYPESDYFLFLTGVRVYECDFVHLFHSWWITAKLDDGACADIFWCVICCV